MTTGKRGFTLIELMISLAIAAILYNALATYYFQSIQQGRDRADAILHKKIAMAYADYITDNYAGVISAMNGSDIAVFNYSSLPSAYKTGISLTNFVPCAIIQVDPARHILFPIIVDVTNNLSYVSDSNTANSAAYLGNYAAVLDAGGVYQSNSGWSINTATSAYFSSGALNSCDYPNLVPKSLAINLSMAPFFAQPKDDTSLNRVDDTSPIGPKNQNVMKTNLVLGYPSNSVANNRYNRIYLANSNTENTQPYIASGKSLPNTSPHYANYYAESHIVLPNSKLLGSSFKSVISLTAGTTTGCNSANLGRIEVEDNTYTFARNILICSYNPIICSLMNSTLPTITNVSYCYLPDTVKTQRISINNSGTYYCPRETPIALNAASNKVVVNLLQRPCKNDGQCGRDNGSAVAKNIIFIYSGLSGSQSILTTANITTGGTTNNVAIGATAPSLAGLSNIPESSIQTPTNNCNSACCTQACGLMGLTSIYNASENIDCSCSAPGSADGIEIYSVYVNSNYNNLNINTVTCTNRTVYK